MELKSLFVIDCLEWRGVEWSRIEQKKVLKIFTIMGPIDFKLMETKKLFSTSEVKKLAN